MVKFVFLRRGIQTLGLDVAKVSFSNNEIFVFFAEHNIPRCSLLLLFLTPEVQDKLVMAEPTSPFLSNFHHCGPRLKSLKKYST